MSRVQDYENVQKQMLDIFKERDLAYGNSTGDTFEKFGVVSYLVRMTDKLNRATNLCKNPEIPTNRESIVDNLLDLANYSILAVMDIQKEESDRLGKISELRD